jgi:Zn-dependent protease with chaperone function
MKKGFLLSVFILVIFVSCKKDKDAKINIFPVEKDKELGAQMDAYINSDSSGMVVLREDQYPNSYARLKHIRDYILASGKLKYKDDFPWKVTIIRDDETLNAFATPGGYMYVYTGLIKYLESEDHLAGVMGHEMAHADRRHGTSQMSKQYGVETLFSLVLGQNKGMLGQMTEGLLSLKFSRQDENDADDYSVQYLCQSSAEYSADGAAGFFEKLLASGSGSNTPAFLSTHPSEGDRVKNIKEKASSLGCNVTEKNPSGFQQMKQELGL